MAKPCVHECMNSARAHAHPHIDTAPTTTHPHAHTYMHMFRRHSHQPFWANLLVEGVFQRNDWPWDMGWGKARHIVHYRFCACPPFWAWKCQVGGGKGGLLSFLGLAMPPPPPPQRKKPVKLATTKPEHRSCNPPKTIFGAGLLE